MNRLYISRSLREAVLARAAGRCECGCNQVADRFEIDHHMPVIFGGPNTLENLRALSIGCHKRATRKLQAGLAKVKRISAAKVTGPLSAQIEAALACRPKPKQRDLISLLRQAVTSLKAHDE